MLLSSQAPEYPLGYGLALGLVWICVRSATLFLFLLHHDNRIRNADGRDDRYNLPAQEKRRIGDSHPAFRLTY
jgi:hypothetical protein